MWQRRECEEFQHQILFNARETSLSRVKRRSVVPGGVCGFARSDPTSRLTIHSCSPYFSPCVHAGAHVSHVVSCRAVPCHVSRSSRKTVSSWSMWRTRWTCSASSPTTGEMVLTCQGGCVCLHGVRALEGARMIYHVGEATACSTVGGRHMFVSRLQRHLSSTDGNARAHTARNVRMIAR